jgi:subfamily B ATP-binding cassette protein MsbA
VRRFLARFLPYFREYIPRFILIAIGMILVAVSTGAIAKLVEPVLDEIFVEKDRQKLMVLPLFIIVTYAAMGIGRYMQSYHTAFVGEDVVRRMRDEMLARLLELDLDFFNRQRGGELISRITNDITRIRLSVSQHMAIILREALVIVALIGVVIWTSPRLAFFGLIALPLAAYPLSVLTKKMKRLSHRSQEKDSDITSRLSEIFNNMEIIKAHSSEAEELRRFVQDNQEFARINMKGVQVKELVNPVMEFAGSIAIAAVIIIGGLQVINDRMTVGTFFAFATALFLLYPPIKRISTLYNKMFDAVAASERIDQMMDRRPSILSGDQPVPDAIASVELEDVVLRYGATTALDGVSLTARRGETVALVGDSGGGKTSVVNLILRLYDPNEGVVRINGIDVKELQLEALRRSIGIVTQRAFIFNDTVAANVAYGEKMNRRRVEAALRAAGAWEFVSAMADGIDTKIEEFGANLSGGQRQRIAIARAIYKQPKILILDEATSALDNQSEARVQAALEEVTRDKVAIVIAHRLTTVEAADRILLLQQGTVVAEGTHEELLERSAEYRRLARSKSSSTDGPTITAAAVD